MFKHLVRRVLKRRINYDHPIVKLLPVKPYLENGELVIPDFSYEGAYKKWLGRYSKDGYVLNRPEVEVELFIDECERSIKTEQWKQRSEGEKKECIHRVARKYILLNGGEDAVKGLVFEKTWDEYFDGRLREMVRGDFMAYTVWKPWVEHLYERKYNRWFLERARNLKQLLKQV